MFPWMNKFLITEKMFLPRLLNRKAAVWWPITANQKDNNNIKNIKKRKKENYNWPMSAKSDKNFFFIQKEKKQNYYGP